MFVPTRKAELQTLQSIQYAGFVDLVLLVITFVAILGINDGEIPNDTETTLSLTHFVQLAVAVPAILVGFCVGLYYGIVFFIGGIILAIVNAYILGRRWGFITSFTEPETYFYFLLDALFLLTALGYISASAGAFADRTNRFEPLNRRDEFYKEPPSSTTSRVFT